MNWFLQLILCGLLANGVLSISDAKSRAKRHIWRGNPNSQTIDEPRYIHTKGGRNNPAALHHPTILTPKCSPYENGIKAHPYNCQMYINCVDGEVTVDTCSEGFLYNSATEECDFASRVACPHSNNGQKSARLHNSYQDSYRDTTHYTNEDRSVISQFKCPHEGLFEHPHDCSKFIQCAHSGLYVQSCGPGTMFNPSLLVCDWPKNVHCNKNVNGNIESESPTHKSEYSHNQRGHETRPPGADYDFDFDVRMSDTNFRNNNNNDQHRIYSTSEIQNEHGQGNYRRSNNSLNTNSRPGQRSYPQYQQSGTQTTPKPNVQYRPDTSPQHIPSRGFYPSRQSSPELHTSDLSLTQQQQEVFPDTSPSRDSQPSRTNVQYRPDTSPQHIASRGFYPPRQSPPELHTSDLSLTQQQQEVFPDTSRSRDSQPSRTNVQYRPDTSPQHIASRGFYPPRQSSPELHTSDLSLTQQQQEVFPDTSPSRDSQPSRTNVQYHARPQSPPSRSLQPPQQTPINTDYHQRTNPEHVSDKTYKQQVEEEAHHGTPTQSRTFKPIPHEPEDFGILTSVLPLDRPRTPEHGNLVHSSPSYSKTKVYSSQQNNPSYPSSNYPSHSSNQYGASNQGREDIDKQVNRQNPSNRQLHNVDQTMDLLDTYANFETPKRFEEHDARTNVMAVERTNSDNRDHEVPIYNRPNNMRFTPRRSDDLDSEESQHTLPLNDALKLMLSPYTKSAPLKNAAVDEMTTKILSTASTFAQDADTLSDAASQIGGIDDAIVGYEPVHNFNRNHPQKANRRDIFDPTPTLDAETHSDFNRQTKIGNFPPTTNSLLVNDGDQNKKLVNRYQPSYTGEVVELFCTTGFDCGNGVCLSSEKMCNGRDDCGNRLDEKNCKHISYDVRLSGEGDRSNIGRIEVKVFDKWGHICGVGFGVSEANVFCREAGFPLGAVEVKINHNYQSQVSVDDRASYILDELRCSGNESSLKECSFNGWDERDCNEETVGVVCKLPDMKCPLNYWLCDQSEECVPTAFLCDAVKDCKDGSDESDTHCNSSIEYRLGNQKSNHKEGRVEVRYKGIWGTVCDDDFGENEAKVFCRSLGYDGAAAVIKEFAKPGEGLIWLDQVSCVGNETSLEACTHFEWGENNCNHTEDVSVRCFEREFETNQKLTMRDPKTIFPRFNEIQHDPTRNSDLDEHCGQIRVADEPENYDYEPVFKVIEGREAKRGHHPWQATLRVRGQNGKSSHWCGAVLISKLHALTAAHCLIGFTKNAYFIRLGDHHSETPEDTEIEVFIEDWHTHENFRKGHLMNNDIALIKLKSAVKYTDYIQPICLPTADTEYTAGKNCTISGWGSTQYGKSTPSLQLRSAHIPIMSQEICKESHNHGSSIQSGMFCAGILGNAIDACDGDSGGPFVCQENEETGYHSLYGIISWGQRCGDKNRPGVYTKVSEYLPWIEEKMLL